MVRFVNSLMQIFSMKNNEAFNKQMHRSAKPRGKEAIRLRKSGLTWREVGEKMGGLSPQRAQALAKAHSADKGKR